MSPMRQGRGQTRVLNRNEHPTCRSHSPPRGRNQKVFPKKWNEVKHKPGTQGGQQAPIKLPLRSQSLPPRCGLQYNKGFQEMLNMTITKIYSKSVNGDTSPLGPNRTPKLNRETIIQEKLKDKENSFQTKQSVARGYQLYRYKSFYRNRKTSPQTSPYPASPSTAKKPTSSHSNVKPKKCETTTVCYGTNKGRSYFVPENWIHPCDPRTKLRNEPIDMPPTKLLMPKWKDVLKPQCPTVEKYKAKYLKRSSITYGDYMKANKLQSNRPSSPLPSTSRRPSRPPSPLPPPPPPLSRPRSRPLLRPASPPLPSSSRRPSRPPSSPPPSPSPGPPLSRPPSPSSTTSLSLSSVPSSPCTLTDPSSNQIRAMKNNLYDIFKRLDEATPVSDEIKKKLSTRSISPPIINDDNREKFSIDYDTPFEAVTLPGTNEYFTKYFSQPMNYEMINAVSAIKPYLSPIDHGDDDILFNDMLAKRQKELEIEIGSLMKRSRDSQDSTRNYMKLKKIKKYLAEL